MKNNKQSSKCIQDEIKVDYAQVFNNNNIVMLLVDPESIQIVDANNAASSYYGWSCEELRQMKISQIDILSEETIKVELSRAKTGLQNHFILKHQLQNHDVHDVEISAVPIKNEDKTLLYFIVHDITKTKESEALLTEAGTIAKIGGWEYDVVSRASKLTPDVYRIYDLELDSSTGIEYTLSFYPHNSRKIIEKAFNDVIEKAEPYDLELELITVKGNHKWVRTIGRPTIENGKVVKVTGAFQDITDRKNVENKLLESEALLSKVGEIAKIGGWEFDIESNKFIRTPELLKIYETDEAQCTLGDPLKYYSAGSREILEKAFNNALDKREAYDLELEIITDKGKHKWVRASGCPKVVNEKVVKITGVLQDITERKIANEKLRESEKRVRSKLTAIVEPDGDVGELELADIIDSQTLQALMDDFYQLTHIGCGIIDNKGKVLVSTGWQDICTNFHRVHPETCKYCIESDLQLSKDIVPGTFKAYKCKNNMWDIATPITVAGLHIGNLFLGQFFFDDEEISYDTFRHQAKKYGFDEKQYLEALEKVPRWSRETVNTVMRFYAQLTSVLSSQSYSNIKLARALKEKDELLKSLHESEEKLKLFIKHAPVSLVMLDRNMRHIAVSRQFIEDYSLGDRDIIGMNHYEVFPDISDKWKAVHQRVMEGELVRNDEDHFERADGTIHWVRWEVRPWKASDGTVGGIVIFSEDITERKEAELSLRNTVGQLRSLVNTIPDLVWLKDVNSTFLACNPKFERLLGAKEVDIIGKNDYDFVDKELADFFRQKDIEALEAGKPLLNEELVTYADDGHEENLETIKSPMYDSNGKLIGVLGVGRDVSERKNAAEKLKQAEQKYKQAYKLLQDVIESPKDVVIFALDKNYRYIAFNKNHQLTMEHVWDARIEIGNTILDYIEDPVDMEKAKANFDRTLAGEAFTVIEEYGNSLHEKQWYENVYSPLKDDEGNVIGLTLLLKDITGRKNADIALRNSEKQMHTLIDTIPDLLWVKDINSVFIACNHKMERLFNANVAEIIGKTDYDFVDKELADFFRQKDIEALVAGRPLINEEMVTYADDGHEEYLETIKTPMYDSSGKLIGTLGIGRDISERKKAEKGILDERRRLANIIEGTNVGTWELNIQTGETLFNERWAEIIGYTIEELSPLDIHKWGKIIHPEDKDKMDRRLKKHFTGELKYYDHEVRMRHKNGEWVWVHARGKVIEWDEEGKPLLMYGTHSDITKRKGAELALLQAKAIAEESNHIKSEFIANMSHELRTPLNSVIGFSQVLTESIHGELNEKQMRYASNILKSGRHLLVLINDILDISKIESGNMEFTPEIIDLHEVIDEISTLMEPLFKDKKIGFEMNIDFQNLEIYADKMKLKQILYNLLSNAIKFTPKKGNVWLDTKTLDDSVQISVRDNGIGIPRDKQQAIFDPFKQVSSFTNRSHGGTGLGLSIAKYYIEMHSGEIHVESEVGKGSIFTIIMPIDLRNN